MLNLSRRLGQHFGTNNLLRAFFCVFHDNPVLFKTLRAGRGKPARASSLWFDTFKPRMLEQKLDVVRQKQTFN